MLIKKSKIFKCVKHNIKPIGRSAMLGTLLGLELDGNGKARRRHLIKRIDALLDVTASQGTTERIKAST